MVALRFGVDLREEQEKGDEAYSECDQDAEILIAKKMHKKRCTKFISRAIAFTREVYSRAKDCYTSSQMKYWQRCLH
jgi:hypothetical protein